MDMNLNDGKATITDSGTLLLDGDVGLTGTRITKVWALDIETTNAIAADITGNAGTVSTITGLAPDTATTAAAQANITSLGTLTGLSVDGAVTINETGADVDFRIEGTGVTHAIFVDGANGNVGIGAAPTVNMTGLSIETGVITIKETTTPTADANYGKIYPQSDNILYFQDGAGAEHKIGDVLKVGTPVNSQIAVWTGDGTAEGAADLTYDGANLQLTGDIGSTGTRITKIWALDIETTNAIAADITGNAGTVSTITGLAPDTATTAAAQANITSLGTLTGLSVDGAVTINDSGADVDLRVEGVGVTHALFVDGANGNVGIGAAPTVNMSGLSIETGVLTIKETTTPTADADYGKIYTKADNLLYYQDGAGVEHALASQTYAVGPLTQAATDTLTASEMTNGIIDNYGQTEANTQTLPTAAAGLNALFQISTAGQGAFNVKAGATDKIYFDGTALDDGDKVSCATPAVGNMLTVVAFRTGATAYDWIATTNSGTWTDGGA